MANRSSADRPRHMLTAAEEARKTVHLSRRVAAGQMDMFGVLFPSEQHNCSQPPATVEAGGAPCTGQVPSPPASVVLPDKPDTPASNTGVQKTRTKKSRKGKDVQHD